jgi:hypothetical protein
MGMNLQIVSRESERSCNARENGGRTRLDIMDENRMARGLEVTRPRCQLQILCQKK